MFYCGKCKLSCQCFWKIKPSVSFFKLTSSFICSIFSRTSDWGSLVCRPSSCILFPFMDFFVNDISCHWLPCSKATVAMIPFWLVTHGSPRSGLVQRPLRYVETVLSSTSCSELWNHSQRLQSHSTCFPHSLPVMSELFKGLFRRACWPHASLACDWLSLLI